MTFDNIIVVGQWVFLLYFIAINIVYLTLNVSAFFSIRRYMTVQQADSLPPIYTDFELPVSIIAPAFNEEITICDSVRALLQLEYTDFEVIVVNDGSQDGTLEVLKEEFSLQRVPDIYRDRIQTKAVHGIYRSLIYPNLKLVDKENGRKADANNAGINVAQFPLVCVVDADSIMQRDSLRRVVQPFLDDSSTIAVGGTVRIANGCRVRQGFIESIGLPRNLIALFQVVEYLRGFLFGRLGWSPMNALLIISGAFGVFHKETVVAAGGYKQDAIGEDMELVVRLHRRARMARKPYKITFVPDPACWTDAPTTLKDLRSQRMRWQRGLAEVLSMHRKLLFHPRAGVVGWLALPFFLIFELLGPVIELAGYVFIIVAVLSGWIDYASFAVFMFVAVGLGTLLSVGSLLLDELSFKVYPRARDTLILFAVAVVENFGYRQLIAVWRLVALIKWMFGAEARWESIVRTGSWTEDTGN